MTAYQEDQILRIALTVGNQFREFRGIETSPRRIQEHFACSRMPLEQIEAHRDNLAHRAVAVPAAALQKFRCQGIRMHIPWLSDEIDEYSHVLP